MWVIFEVECTKFFPLSYHALTDVGALVKTESVISPILC